MKIIDSLFMFAASQDQPIKLDAGSGSSGINAPVVAANDAALQSALNTAYMWAGIICVLIIVIGGVRYATSNGDSAGIQSAKNTIIYALVGLVVILAAAGITQLIIGRF